MKTNSTLFPGIRKLIVSGLIAFLLVVNVSAQIAKPQEEKSRFLQLNSISGMSSLSGIGFGLRFSPMVGFRINDKTSLHIGPVMKMEKPHYSGYTVKGRYLLMHSSDSYSGSTFLYLFTSFERLKNQYFSDKWNEIELLTSRHTRSEDFDFKKVKFEGYEIAGGFAVGHKMSERFSLNMEFGVSVYKTTRKNFETMRLYHQPQGLTLHLSLTARYLLHRN